MWIPADLSAVPTKSDLKHAKEAIDAIELKLEKARRVASTDQQPELQDSIAGMVKDLEERKAWISPIRLLTFDALSLIFEFSSKADWKAPIWIGAVCRTWRSVVLATPRAWTHVDLVIVSGHQKNLFLERSGQLPLHVLLDSEDYAGVVGMAHRIQCMATDDLPPIGEEVCFPNLTRMQLGSGEGATDPQLLTKQRFPALKHLVANTLFINDFGIPSSPMPPSFPPIQTLWLVVDWSPAWLDVLQGCKESLIELGILFDDFQDTWSLGGNLIHMPRLKFLQVDYIADGTEEPLKLTTPALRAYMESTYDDIPCGVAAETSRVTHMRADGIPTLASTMDLRVLQIRIPLERLESLLEQLRSSDHCPDLQTMEIMFIPRVTAQDKIRIFESWEEINRPNVDFRIFDGKWSMEFSNGFSGSCGKQMPSRRPG